MCMATGVASTISRTSGARSISPTRKPRSGARRMGRPPRRVVIEARDFVEAARERGFEWYAGVPCSYLTPFINYVLQDPTLQYVSTANEGDAVALIAGVTLAGAAGGRQRRGVALMQNSALWTAVSPVASVT